ncbi:MAG TPA: VC0807 family protein [Chloroflexota bacterium]|jgi:intracellular septation protein A|nr:VC0807 family protein [Chloroflexota bacterium]
MDIDEPAIKHWRTFGAAEWGHVKEGALGLVLGSLLPVLLFYVTFRSLSFGPAVVAVLTWSTLIFVWHLRRTGGADVFSATTFGFACVKAAAGLVSGDTWVYLAWPSLENVIYGTAFFASALLGRPLLALYAQRLYPVPADVRTSRQFKRAFVITSAVWLVGHSVRAALRLWLLATLPLEVYLVADTVAGWPINATLVVFTTWFPLRQLRRAGFMSVRTREISAIDAIELVVEESVPTTV